MDFYTFSGVAILIPRIINPDDFLSLAVDFDDLISSFSSKNVTGLKHMDVMDTAPFHFPFYIAKFIYNCKLTVSLCYHGVLCSSGIRK